MKTLFGVLLASLTLSTNALAFEPPSDQAEPTLQCDVMLFPGSEGQARPVNCGRVSLTTSKNAVYGVGECRAVAIDLVQVYAKSGDKTWIVSAGMSDGSNRIQQASCISFFGSLPPRFSFRGNLNEGTIQMNCRTLNWQQFN